MTSRLANTSLYTVSYSSLYMLYGLSDEVWDAGNVVCYGSSILSMWDVWNVRCLGCGMFRMWDVWDVGCSDCGMFGMWDVRDVGDLGCWGCGMFTWMWDVDLQNALVNGLISNGTNQICTSIFKT